MTTSAAVPPQPAVPAAGGGRGHGAAVAIAHELPAAAVMLAACLAGGAAALCAGAVTLALVSVGYAPSARTSPFAREHVVDLWAMLLLMVGSAFAGVSATASPSGHHHLAAVASAPVSGLLVAVAVGGWVLGRIVLARAVRRPHTLVSAVVCGGMLAVMLAV